jgi:chemotaxis protein methyltransferase CheR
MSIIPQKMPFLNNIFPENPIPNVSDVQALTAQPLSQEEYDSFCDIIYKNSRISLGPHKKDMVAARLIKRLKACHLPSFKDYLQLINSTQGHNELTHFIDALSTNHTFFFREIAHFNFLKQTILPKMIANPSRVNKHFRVWSAACSSGEEPYSIAILLAEFFQNYPQWTWSIQATDISTRILEMARLGNYEQARLGTIDNNILNKYFQKNLLNGAELFQISPLLKAKVNFQQLNLFSSTYPFTDPFDLIFCRNVMIYFDTPTKQELIAKLCKTLTPGGYFYSGHAESLTSIRHNLSPIQVSIFQKNLEN